MKISFLRKRALPNPNVCSLPGLILTFGSGWLRLWLMTIEVAGMPEDQVKLTITDNVLVIKGEKVDTEVSESTFHRKERRFGNFQRAISLPPNLQTDLARAGFTNGLLTVVIPKAEAVKPKEIEIQVS